jgi:hypothetical protein
MQNFDVAHVREQGVDLIIVFVAERVRSMSTSDTNGLITSLTLCARSAGLAGHVVLVWRGGFFADPKFHAFFESAPYEVLAASVNKKLSCSNM